MSRRSSVSVPPDKFRRVREYTAAVTVALSLYAAPMGLLKLAVSQGWYAS